MSEPTTPAKSKIPRVCVTLEETLRKRTARVIDLTRVQGDTRKLVER
jgi:hypothetical protein